MKRKARRLAHFGDPRLEVQIDELVRAQNEDVAASEAHEARTDNPHQTTPEQIGAETPAGAQGKVDSHSKQATGVHGVGTHRLAKTTRADQWPDWQDVQGKPAQYPPEAHAATHASGGSDPVTPASIGAETPSGAQVKADLAEANAKAYTDAHAARSDIHVTAAQRAAMDAAVAPPSASNPFVTEETLNNAMTGSAKPGVATLADLAAIPPEQRADKDTRLVEQDGRIYRFDADATTGDVQPNVGTGYWIAVAAATQNHNNLSGLQGGSASERYHLTLAERDTVVGHPSKVTGVHGVGAGYIAKTSRADQWPDWSDVQNKPTSYPPSAHAASHASSGSDAITPASIGAETPAGAQAKADAVQSALNTHKTAATLDHPDGSVTDAKVGNRTVDQASAPTGHTGTLSQLLSWLANRIRAITGAANWYDSPATTLAAAKSHMDAAAPHSGHETPTGAQAKVDAHAAAKTGVHGVGTAYVAKTSRSDQLPSWADIPDKPATFPPGAHTHDDRYYTESESDGRYVLRRKVSESTPGAGWRRFAYGQSNCSYNGALFKLRYTISGKHGVIIFAAGITFGQRPILHVLARTTYGGDTGITELRLVYKGTYDQPYLEYYCDAASIAVEVEMLDNSNAGWTLQAIGAGSIPSGYTALTRTLAGTVNTGFDADLVRGRNLAGELDAHKSAATLDHPDGSVTDAKIGNRTADQTQAPTGSTGTLTQLFSWVANRIKAITGTTNWYDDPATTLAAAKSHMDAAAPHPGHETPVGAQAKANTAESNAKAYTDGHAGTTTGVHGVGGYRVAKSSRTDQWPDWADVQSKPVTFPPSAHKSTHASGGSDALTPSDIGAVNKAGDTMAGPLQFENSNKRIVYSGEYFSLESREGNAFLSGKSGAHVAGNAYYDGTNWQRYDTARAAYVLSAYEDRVVIRATGAGSNPISWAYENGVLNTGSIIPVTNLKLATGNASAAYFAVNRYAFASPYKASSGTEGQAVVIGAANEGSGYVRYWAMVYVSNGGNWGNGATVATGGSATVSWDYLTASGRPRLWALVDDAGHILGMWEAEDPADPEEPDACPIGLEVIDERGKLVSLVPPGGAAVRLKPPTQEQLAIVMRFLSNAPLPKRYPWHSGLGTPPPDAVPRLQHGLFRKMLKRRNLETPSDIRDAYSLRNPNRRDWYLQLWLRSASRVICDHRTDTLIPLYQKMFRVEKASGKLILA